MLPAIFKCSTVPTSPSLCCRAAAAALIIDHLLGICCARLKPRLPDCRLLCPGSGTCVNSVCHTSHVKQMAARTTCHIHTHTPASISLSIPPPPPLFWQRLPQHNNPATQRNVASNLRKRQRQRYKLPSFSRLSTPPHSTFSPASSSPLQQLLLSLQWPFAGVWVGMGRPLYPYDGLSHSSCSPCVYVCVCVSPSSSASSLANKKNSSKLIFLLLQLRL